MEREKQVRVIIAVGIVIIVLIVLYSRSHPPVERFQFYRTQPVRK